jgi:hypothetical protein
MWASNRGKHWTDGDLDGRFSARIKYEHEYAQNFPQSASHPQHVWCYPDAAPPEFRRLGSTTSLIVWRAILAARKNKVCCRRHLPNSLLPRFRAGKTFRRSPNEWPIFNLRATKETAPAQCGKNLGPWEVSQTSPGRLVPGIPERASPGSGSISVAYFDFASGQIRPVPSEGYQPQRPTLGIERPDLHP